MKTNAAYAALSPPQLRLRDLAVEHSCTAAGIIDPLIVDADGYLLDGHLRLEIAKEHELDFETKELSFGSEPPPRQWIIVRALESKGLTRGQSLLLRHDLLELAHGRSARVRAESVVHLFPDRDPLEVVDWLSAGRTYGRLVDRCDDSVRAAIWVGDVDWISRSQLRHTAQPASSPY